MKIEYIEPFIVATKKAFIEVIGKDVQPGQPHLYRSEEDLREVNAIIGLAGEARGAVIISFSEQGSLKIASQFTGQACDTVDDTVADAIGELANIIAGNAKEGLIEFRIYISLPKVITSAHDMKLPKSVPAITVPFACVEDSFNLTVALAEEKI